jgi:hypothetical protein
MADAKKALAEKFPGKPVGAYFFHFSGSVAA